VKVLSELGLQPAEIAPMVGSNRKAVALRLLRMRRKEKPTAEAPPEQEGTEAAEPSS